MNSLTLLSMSPRPRACRTPLVLLGSCDYNSIKGLRGTTSAQAVGNLTRW